MTPIRVGIVCDLREEGWHSMDLVADMLMDRLPAVAGSGLEVTRLCPPMVPRWTRVPWVGRSASARLGDRLMGRLWDYPRWLRLRTADFDVFHIVDHSYAHLVLSLPAGRTVVTCHDMDAVQAALPGNRHPPGASRLLAARILDGLAHAGHVACVSEATRTGLLATGRVRPERVSVVYNGVHPSCSPEAAANEDAVADVMIGSGSLDILHVGSTIPRKRIDVLLEMIAGVRRTFTDVRLLRVGGPLTRAQHALAGRLGVLDAIVELPFVDRPTLASLYRRAHLVVLPSDREGFGLPLVEAMACGTPVVASAIPALQEIGGSGAVYCPPGDVTRWVETVIQLLQQQRDDPAGWDIRRRAAISAAARFDWSRFAAGMNSLYRILAS